MNSIIYVLEVKRQNHTPNGLAFPGGSEGKESVCNVGDPDFGWDPGGERSPGEGNGYPIQYSFLENSMDRGGYSLCGHKEFHMT